MIRFVLAASMAGVLLAPLPAAGQYGPPPPDLPDLMNTRLPAPGHLELDAIFRIDPGDDAARNLRSLRLGYGYGGYGWLSLHYGKTDDVVRDDEWEVAGRLVPLSAAVGAPVDLALTGAWNDRARSFDTELALGIPLGEDLTLIGAARRFSDFGPVGEAAWAGAGGIWARIGDRVTVGGDLIFSQEVDDPVWGGQVEAGIPGTPIRLAIEVGNGVSTTLQGSALAEDVRAGLRLSFPLAPSLWAAGGGGRAPRTGEADVVAVDTLRVAVTDGGFEPASATVAPGTIVLWVNEGEAVHSATASDGSWASPLLAPGESYGRVFTAPGEVVFRCQLHPEEEGALAVSGG